MQKSNISVTGFEHLHVHTTYSLLDGFALPSELAQKCVDNNHDFLCITDHSSLGAIPAQIKALEEISVKKVKPIFGCELYLNPLHTTPTPTEESCSEFIKTLTPEDTLKFRKSYHILALAYNEQGYKNLVKLSSWAFQNGFYYKPRVNREILKEFKDGILFTSCCYNSEIGQAFEHHGKEAAEEMLVLYKNMFGENFVLEIMMLDFKKQKPYNAFILKMKEKYHLPCILTQDVHYACKEDSKFQRYMLMVGSKRTIQEIEKLSQDPNVDLFELQDSNLWYKSELELNNMWIENYSDNIDFDLFQEAKRTTVEIARKCSGVEFDRSIKFPQIENGDAKLREEISKGIKFRNIPRTKTYQNRVKEEYDLICRKGFSSYFLITQETLRHAREAAPLILGAGYAGRDAVGCGRGSAAGSLVAFLLGITDVDPIQHGLLFSRFLSDARGGKQLKLRFSD
jgi:DNA polymerase-3 subunit alpha